MIFRQLFDSASSTYTYLIASRRGGEALIIDSVVDRVDRYIKLLAELDLTLVKAVDTHVHADHITGLGALRDRTRCTTVMGKEAAVDVVSMRVSDGDRIEIEGAALEVIYTPGHTDDSYSFLMGERVFTGDTLLIRGTGRTDFQNGDPAAQFDSIFNKLLKLPDETLVYPAHDYKGDTVSTIAEEKACNPRLQVDSVEQYVAIMNSLDLPNPPQTVDGDVALGKQAYETCIPCHGEFGQGAQSLDAPRLSNQHDWYIVRQLENFNAGIRGGHQNDIYGAQMRIMSQMLESDERIRAVAAYVASLEYQPGDE